MNKGIILIIISVLLVNCRDSSFYSDISDVCTELNLTNCSIEFNYLADSGIEENEQCVVLSFEETDSVDFFYLNNPNYLTSRLAFEIYELMMVNEMKEYSTIQIKGVISDSLINNSYRVDAIKSTSDFIAESENFINLLESKDNNGIRELTDSDYVSNELLMTFSEATNKMALCGEIKEIECIGLDFEVETETNENITFIKNKIFRESSEDEHTYCIRNSDGKFIYIQLNSNLECFDSTEYHLNYDY